YRVRWRGQAADRLISLAGPVKPGATCREPIPINTCHASPDRYRGDAVCRTTSTLNASGRFKRNLRRLLRLPRVPTVAAAGIVRDARPGDRHPPIVAYRRRAEAATGRLGCRLQAGTAHRRRSP